MDDSADMVKVAHRLMQFYQNESCGKCTPCREGTRWVVQMLASIEAGGGTIGDLKVIEDVCNAVWPLNSFCPLAVGAAPPIVSAIRRIPGRVRSLYPAKSQRHRPSQNEMSYPYL